MTPVPRDFQCRSVSGPLKAAKRLYVAWLHIILAIDKLFIAEQRRRDSQSDFLSVFPLAEWWHGIRSNSGRNFVERGLLPCGGSTVQGIHRAGEEAVCRVLRILSRQ